MSLREMKVVGITGGIGSGKTLVGSVFSSLGIPVFNADEQAKSIYENHPELLRAIKIEFGEGVMIGEKLNRQALAQIVFTDPSALKKLNALIHPEVTKTFNTWKLTQVSPYVMREAAIMIESNNYQDCAHLILVSADEEIRRSRVVKRSALSENEVGMRMKNQMTDDQRRSFCDFEIRNSGDELILPQIAEIHTIIMDEMHSLQLPL